MIRSALLIFMLLSAAMLPACASSSRTASPRSAPAGVGPYLDRPRDIPLFRADGTRASWADLIADASRADAVLLGENHGHSTGLAVAAAIWQDIIASSSSASTSGPALALEFWERDEQNTLDDYLTSVTDDAAFQKAAGPSKAPGSPSFPQGHVSMVSAAKAAGRPVVAANAPRRYVRLARTEGFDRLRALTPRQRELFRIPDTLAEGRYRDDFEKVMGAKPNDAGVIPRENEAMFRSQQVWDWTMAQSVATLINQGHAPAMLVVGCFHIDHTGGLVQALQAQRPGTRTLTISFISEDTPTTLPDTEKGRADYIIYAGKR